MSRIKFNPAEVTSREKVGSHYINEQLSNMRNDIRELYRKSSFQIGRTTLISDLMTTMDYTISTLLADDIDTEDNEVLVGISTPDKMMYPSSVQDVHKVHVDNVYKVMTLNRIQEDNQIVETHQGKVSVRSDIGIVRNTNNNVYLEKVSAITETDYRAPFIYDDPYVIKFSKDTPIERANVNYMIKSGTRTMKFNTVRILPIPSIGNTLLDKFIIRKAGKNVNLNDPNDTPFDISMIDELKRTMPLYMTVGETECDQIYISFDTHNYIYTMNASLISLGYIGIDMVNYSSKSYIGFEIDIPDGYSILNGIEIIPNELNVDPSVYCDWKIYDNWEDFDVMSDNFIVSSDHILGTDGYRGLTSDKLYLLLEMKETSNNSSPLVRSLKVKFSEET